MEINIWDIIAAKIHGELLSVDEEAKFCIWLESNVENEAVYQQLRMIYEDQEVFRKCGGVDVDDAYRKNRAMLAGKRKIQRRRMWGWIGYAASFLVVGSMAAFLFYQTGKQTDKEKTMAGVGQIFAGSSKAVLTLSSGKSVVLEEQNNVTIREKDGILNNKGNVLEYSATDSAVKSGINFNTLDIPRGGEYRLTLEDGTQVWLNSESRLKFPVIFGRNERCVFLEGEAYFSVKKDRERPFIVCTRKTRVEVLGTEFNITSYEESKAVYTTLVVGSVKISDDSDFAHFKILRPAEQASYDIETGNITTRKVNVRLYTSWKDGFYAFEQERLEDIMHTLERWYDMKVFFANQYVKGLKFSGRVKRYEDITNFLNVIKLTNDVDFEIRGKTITVKN